ncbi:MAG: preprotein translocase subunit SecE [Ruminococcaceae bacterium]|nr:preprotein translocase subunit SecE [Oscillospiraceae bacterium]
MAEVTKEKKPNRIAKFFRDYKSELKKITWNPFKNTKASTILVIATVVALAVVIAVLDWGSSAAVFGLRDLFN